MSVLLKLYVSGVQYVPVSRLTLHVITMNHVIFLEYYWCWRVLCCICVRASSLVEV